MFYTRNHSRWCIFTEVMVNEKQYTYNIQRVSEISTVAAVEISDRKDLNTLYKFRNLISVNRIFIKDYKVSVSI
jgi:hypothetical protein